MVVIIDVMIFDVIFVCEIYGWLKIIIEKKNIG